MGPHGDLAGQHHRHLAMEVKGLVWLCTSVLVLVGAACSSPNGEVDQAPTRAAAVDDLDPAAREELLLTAYNMFGPDTGLLDDDWVELSRSACAAESSDELLAIADGAGLSRDSRSQTILALYTVMAPICRDSLP